MQASITICKNRSESTTPSIKILKIGQFREIVGTEITKLKWKNK